jgi:hypothetical protein
LTFADLFMPAACAEAAMFATTATVSLTSGTQSSPRRANNSMLR